MTLYSRGLESARFSISRAELSSSLCKQVGNCYRKLGMQCATIPELEQLQHQIQGRAAMSDQHLQEMQSDGALTKLQIAIEETERLGEVFLDVRAEMVQLDRQRQETREAMTAIRKMKTAGSSSEPVLISRPCGVVMKVSRTAALDMLQQDQEFHEGRLEHLRREEKRLMGLLSDKGAGPTRAGPTRAGPGMMQAMLNLRDAT